MTSCDEVEKQRINCASTEHATIEYSSTYILDTATVVQSQPDGAVNLSSKGREKTSASAPANLS